VNPPRGVELQTADADATRGVGAVLAAHLRPGDVVSLAGELGAGKTCLVQGVARALDVPGRVTSPTFVLVKHYRGRLDLVHVDVYRLDHVQDVLDLGDEVLAPDAVTFVEWGDAVATVLPDDRLDVELVLADPDELDSTRRRVRLTGRGGWAPRVDALREALGASDATGT
jgi:tRNA threonylcarbamoyladenosine biosynthesis protein TsaE